MRILILASRMDSSFSCHAAVDLMTALNVLLIFIPIMANGNVITGHTVTDFCIKFVARFVLGNTGSEVFACEFQ
jgi:hypothetical protein